MVRLREQARSHRVDRISNVGAGLLAKMAFQAL